MNVSTRVAMQVTAKHLDPVAVSAVLTRVESAVPHLIFESWRVRDSNVPGPEGKSVWRGSDRIVVEVGVTVTSLTLWSRLSRDAGAVSTDDYRFLHELAGEAAQVLASSIVGGISLVDFGTQTVAREMKGRLSLEYDLLPLLRFVRSLAQETYENQRLSYGAILTRSSGGGAHISTAFDNKRFKRITDGFSTALVLDIKGQVVELAPLEVPPGEAVARKRRPWWAAAIGAAARTREGAGIALTRNGDLLIVYEGQLVYTQRAGKWVKWDHAAILERLNLQWDFIGAPQAVRQVLSYLYHVALDLSFRRSGGLLVVVGSQDRVRALLASRNDIIGSARRKQPEKSLDSSLARRAIFRNDRHVTADLASLDGALAVDRTGKILAYGAMTKASKSAQQGARTRAAFAASREGVAIKVSSDGDISFFRRGKKRFEI